jgi:hypothetical protein
MTQETFDKAAEVNYIIKGFERLKNIHSGPPSNIEHFIWEIKGIVQDEAETAVLEEYLT